MKDYVVVEDVDAYVGKHMSEICPSTLSGSDKNQCAHFVSHVLGYTDLDTETCKNLFTVDKVNEKVVAANIRVDSIFNACPSRGDLSDGPLCNQVFLVFVTNSWNMYRTGKGELPMMKDGSKKHIGICVGGNVYHYSNSAKKVLKDSEALFKAKFETSYRVAGQSVLFFYGSLLK